MSEDAPLISGQADDNPSDPLEVSFVVEDTKDFTREQLSSALARAALESIPLMSADTQAEDSRWATWAAGRFRKILRRAKPTLFARIVADVPGAALVQTHPQVVVVPPLRKSEIAKPLSRAQISGLTVLPSVMNDAVSNVSTVSNVCKASNVSNDAPTLQIIVNDDLGMSASKGAVAAAHAAQVARQTLAEQHTPAYQSWVAAHYPVRVIWGDISGNAQRASDAIIRDAGFTEVAPGSITAMASFVAPL